MGSTNAIAWTLACRLFSRDGPVLESALSDSERGGLAVLADIGALVPVKLDLRFVLCPYCQLLRGPVVQGKSGLVCQCLDCGSVPVDLQDTRAWELNSEWLIRKLRVAFDVPAQQGHLFVISGVWRIGSRQRRPLILARSLDHILQHPSSLSRAGARSANPPWLIAPKPLIDVDADPFNGSVVWLPLEERFSPYGGNVQFIEPTTTIVSTDDDSAQAVNGPFSADFCWVHLADWPHGPIALTEGQSSVFKALWHYQGRSQSAEIIMNKAGLDSDKPIDVFKVKTKNKGDPKYEGPLQAYNSLVKSNQRLGTYAMPCSATVMT